MKERTGASENEVEEHNARTVFPALKRLDEKTASMGYQAWLGYYNSNLKRIGWNKISLVENANLFSKNVLNLQTPPGLQKRTIGKMGLKGIPGLRIAPHVQKPPRGGKR